MTVMRSLGAAFGENLARGTHAAPWNVWGELPVALDGVSVTVNGAPAGLYYVSPQQINFLVPADAAAGEAETAPCRHGRACR